MAKTQLVPAALEDQSPKIQAQLIQAAVGAYASALFAKVDQLAANPAAKTQEIEAIQKELNALHGMTGALPETLRPAFMEKSGKLRELVEVAQADWQKGTAPPTDFVSAGAPSAGKAALWAEHGTLYSPKAPIAQNPKFQQWVKKNSQDINAQLAAQLAENMTWEEAELLDRLGGIHVFAAKQGCEHCCLGCLVRAGDRRPIKQESWEDFTNSVRALVGLQQVLQTLRGKPVSLINRNFVIPFYDSEPMSIMFPTRNGPPKTIVDMVKFLYETAGVRSDLVSSGWNPRSLYAENAAKQIVEDIVAGSQAPYLLGSARGKLVFQIKPVAKRFRDEARAFITPIVKADKEFQKNFGEEFEEFGFDFKKYPKNKGPPASKAYAKIVQEHLKDFVDSSGYLKDRIENLKTLAPTIKKGLIGLNIYYSNKSSKNPDVLFLAPWLTKGTVIAMLNFMQPHFDNAMGGGIVSKKDFYKGKWELSALGPLDEGPFLGMAIALFNGTIGFSGASLGATSQQIPNLATNRRVLRELSDNPILFLANKRPLWSVAADRLDGTRHLDITKPVQESIAQRIAEISKGTISPTTEEVDNKAVLMSAQGKRLEAGVRVQAAGNSQWFRFAQMIAWISKWTISPKTEEVASQAVLMPVQGKRPEAWMKVHAAGINYLFRFADGYLYDMSEPPKLVAPQ